MYVCVHIYIYIYTCVAINTYTYVSGRRPDLVFGRGRGTGRGFEAMIGT